jgi:guanosine-3',5'-bis(diphosphate) 3'-pyrophosphohydrolase
MTEPLAETYRPLLEALSFSARAHRHQLRKDGQTPYAAHPCRVCLIVRHVFGFDEPRVLQAAALHDTIEDTTTDFDDLIERFGPEVAGWVAVLSKDKRLKDAEREAAYARGLAEADWPVKVCKLADIFDNLLDSRAISPAGRRKGFARSRFYLDALSLGLPEPARRPFEIVTRLLNELEATESPVEGRS